MSDLEVEVSLEDEATPEEAKLDIATVPSAPEATPVEAESTATPTEIELLQIELDELRSLTAEAFEFAANELRPLFGQGALALVFDGCAKGIREAGK